MLYKHITVFCTDNTTRRFYEAQDGSDIGHIVYRGDRVKGRAIQMQFNPRRYYFEPYTETIIPKVEGWKVSHNCGAVRFCERARRCVGGCKQ